MFLLGKLKMYAALFGAATLAIATAYFRGRADGSDGLEYEIKDERIADLLRAKEIENEVENLDNEQLADRASKWVRHDSID